jgi:hypothetical protein
MKRKSQAKPKEEKKYLILELLEEDVYTEAELKEELSRVVTRDFLEHVTPVKDAIMIEWLPGTRFFIAPASLFFSDEAVRDEKE